METNRAKAGGKAMKSTSMARGVLIGVVGRTPALIVLRSVFHDARQVGGGPVHKAVKQRRERLGPLNSTRGGTSAFPLTADALGKDVAVLATLVALIRDMPLVTIAD